MSQIRHSLSLSQSSGAAASSTLQVLDSSQLRHVVGGAGQGASGPVGGWMTGPVGGWMTGPVGGWLTGPVGGW